MVNFIQRATELAALQDYSSPVPRVQRRAAAAAYVRISAIMIDQFGNVITVIGNHDQWGSMAACTQSGPLDFAC